MPRQGRKQQGYGGGGMVIFPTRQMVNPTGLPYSLPTPPLPSHRKGKRHRRAENSNGYGYKSATISSRRMVNPTNLPYSIPTHPKREKRRQRTGQSIQSIVYPTGQMLNPARLREPKRAAALFTTSIRPTVSPAGRGVSFGQVPPETKQEVQGPPEIPEQPREEEEEELKEQEELEPEEQRAPSSPPHFDRPIHVTLSWEPQYGNAVQPESQDSVPDVSNIDDRNVSYGATGQPPQFNIIIGED